MKKFLVCSLDDMSYTEASYEFCNNLAEAREICIENAVFAYGLVNENDAVENMIFEVIDSEKGVYKYNYANEDDFFVNYIIPIDVEDDDYLLVWHHAYNGVDFSVDMIGTMKDCANCMDIESNNLLTQNEGYDVDYASETQIVIDTQEEWEIFDIIKYNQ